MGLIAAVCFSLKQLFLEVGPFSLYGSRSGSILTNTNNKFFSRRNPRRVSHSRSETGNHTLCFAPRNALRDSVHNDYTDFDKSWACLSWHCTLSPPYPGNPRWAYSRTS